MATCSHGGAAPGAQFCPNCGTALAMDNLTDRRLCLWCANACPAASEFCDRCGASSRAVRPGLSLPAAWAWSEIFTEMGWGNFKGSASWGLFAAKKQALEVTLGNPSTDPGNPWVFATESDTQCKPGRVRSIKARGPGVPAREASRFLVKRFVAATRCEIAVPYFEDAFVTVLNVKNKPPAVSRIAFVDINRATWSGSTLLLATSAQEIEMDIRPAVSTLNKFLSSTARWAALASAVGADGPVDTIAYKHMHDTHAGRSRVYQDVETTFDAVMRRFCEEVLAVSPTGLPRSGWYADPYRRMQWRWWDGVAWTSRCSANSQEVSDPDFPKSSMYPLPEEGRRAR